MHGGHGCNSGVALGEIKRSNESREKFGGQSRLQRQDRRDLLTSSGGNGLTNEGCPPSSKADDEGKQEYEVGDKRGEVEPAISSGRHFEVVG